MARPFYPVGRYACKVVAQGFNESREKKTPQFVLRFTVMGQVDPADPTKYIPAQQQFERTFYRAITENTMQYFLEDLRTLGFTGESFRELDPATPNFYDLTGNDVDMWCAHEKGQDGEEREKWSVARVGSGDFKIENPLDNKRLRELDNLFGKHLKGMKSNGKTTAAPTAQPVAGQVITDDDVPF